MRDFGLDIWGDDNFLIRDGEVALNYGSLPSLLDIAQKIRAEGHRGPILLRFPHLIKKQVSILFDTFDAAIEEFGYQGKFHAVFPLKVNQYPNFVDALMEVGASYGYGLEAGSK